MLQYLGPKTLLFGSLDPQGRSGTCLPAWTELAESVQQLQAAIRSGIQLDTWVLHGEETSSSSSSSSSSTSTSTSNSNSNNNTGHGSWIA